MDMKCRFTVFVLFSLCVCTANVSRGDLFDIVASNDARVLSFFPNTNEGNGALLSVYNNPGNIQRTYVHFNLTGLPILTVTGDGTLNLTATGDANDSVTNGTLFVAGGSWDESLITWNNQPGTTGLGLSSVSGVYTQTVTWTVPQAVLQGWFDNPTSNNGLVLVSDVGSTLTFHSSENLSPAFQPRLIFNAIPEPTTALLVGCVLLAGSLRRQRR
jgi:hypothetical protein